MKTTNFNELYGKRAIENKRKVILSCQEYNTNNVTVMSWLEFQKLVSQPTHANKVFETKQFIKNMEAKTKLDI